MLNVNFLDCEPDAIKGMVVTSQGQRNPDLLRIEDRLDTRGKPYYWVGLERRRQAAKGPLGGAVRPHLGDPAPARLHR